MNVRCTITLPEKELKQWSRHMQHYRIVHGNGGWAISENKSEPAGSYATREGALEAVYLAASNDIKKGLGISIIIDPPGRGEAAIGGAAS
jgi:hypothetical protein